MQKTEISWTHYSSNPLRYRDPDGNIVHACVHASEGCSLCYSEKLAPRWGKHGKPFTAENMKRLTPFLDEKELHHILTYKPAAGKMCFVCDMTDLFGEWVPDELIDRLFAVFALRPDVTFQILTKRADRMREYFQELTSVKSPFAPHDNLNRHSAVWFETETFANQIKGYLGRPIPWPLPNVWLGVSVETQKWADIRIPDLLATPPAKRFVSYEPALGPVDFRKLRHDLPPMQDGFKRVLGDEQEFNALRGERIQGRIGYSCSKLDWVICGGESGSGARPFNVNWARSVVSQCKAAGVACFVKQMGTNPVRFWNKDEDSESLLVEGGDESKAVLEMVFDDYKGGCPEEWPEDLRVREFPK